MGVDGRQERVTTAGDVLRHKAVKRLGTKNQHLINMSPEQAQDLIYLLSIHETELKMQNERLCQLQVQLEASKRKYSTLYELAPIGYLTLDQAGKIVEANLAATNQLSIGRNQLLHTFLDTYAAPQDRERLLSHLRQVFLSKQRGSCEILLRARNGNDFSVRLESVPWRDDDGTDLCLTSVMDISARKHTEAGLLASNAALQYEVEERCRAQEKLETSERRLRELSTRLLSAAEIERKRISWEIHDSIGSSLTAIKMFLSNVLRQAKEGVVDTEDLSKIIALTRMTTCEVRRIMTDLRPSVLDDFGIVAAMRWFCQEILESSPTLRMVVHIDIEEDIVPEVLKIVIFRILQESLHNINKHSKAQSVEVSLGVADKRIELVITDDGVGFELDSTLEKRAHRGMGLVGMKERTELSGGILSIQSSIGQGTGIRASWPMPE